MQNLGGGFVVFFLGAKISTLEKLGGLKLLLSLMKYGFLNVKTLKIHF
jgi:hypothetical protein